MKKCVVKLNTNAEKIIATASLSTALAILFGGKNKKKKRGGNKNFVQRFSRNYKVIDNLLSMTIARETAKNIRRKAEQAEKEQYKTKLRDLEIEQAEFIDL